MTRILVKDLEPGRTHYIQARVNNGTEVSDWSSKHVFTTVSDTLAPAPVTGLAWTVEGTAFKAVWTGPITNSDGTPLMDLKDYQVKVYSPAAPSTVATYYTSAARFDFPFEANVNAFATPRAQVTVEIRARDNTGNLSTVVSATASNPAPANVTGLTATGISDGVALQWAPITDTDLKHYEVRQGTSLGNETNLVYTGRGTSFVFTTTATVPQYFAVVAVDVFGTSSATAAKANATPRSTLSVDTTPPAAPTNVQVTSSLHSTDPTQSSAFIDVTWTGVADTDLQNYLVRYASSSTTTTFQYIEVPEGVTEARIHNLKTNTDFYIKVCAVDYAGNQSTWTQAATYPITTAKDTAAPAAPTGVTVAAGVTTATIVWNENTEGDVKGGQGYYEVQIDTANTFNTGNLQTKQVSGTVVSFSNLTSNTTYYTRVRAVDGAGNAGAYSSIVSGTPRYVANVDIQAGTISGDKITAATLAGDRVIANTLDAAALKANTAFVNDLLINSKFTMNTTGTMQSSNYVAGTSGWQLKNNTLEIVDGVILAKALKLQNGVNLIHPAYADFEWNPTWYTGSTLGTGGGSPSWSIVTAPTVTAKYGAQCLKLTRPAGIPAGTDTDLFLGPNSSTYNVSFEPGVTYIWSAWMMTPSGSGPKTVQLKLRTGDGTWTSFGGTQVIPDTGVWTRISGTRTIAAGITSGVMFYGLQTQGDVYIDANQLEVMATSETAPSQWKPPSFTTVDGGIIKTGSIQSTASANGLAGQPAWSINTQGNAQFGDANVRGRLVVGDPNNPSADGVNSRIYSSNYVPGSTGWIIRSDGYAEFRNLAVNSVKVTAFDSPFQNTAAAKLYDYMQDGNLWLTNGAVVQKTDPGAFSANSLFEFTGPGLIIRNGTGVQPIAFDPTILYRVSARVRAYSVTPLNTNGDFENATLTNWSTDTTGSTTTLSLSTTEKYAGTKSLQMASSSATSGVYRAWTGVDNLKAGYTYTLNARIKANIQAAYYNASNQGNIELRVTYFSGAGQSGYLSEELYLIAPPVDSSGVMLTAPTTWFPVSATFTPPAGATSANFIIRLARYDNVTAGTTIGWIDDVQITTPPRIKLGVFGTDMSNYIVDYDYVNDATTPTKKHAFPAAGSYGTLSSYTAGQYMCVADNDEIATAVASSGTTADWVTLTGYIKGRGGSGTDGTFGNPAKANDPYQPASLNTNVSYLIPYVEFDVASGTKAQVDQFSLEAFEGGAPGKVATGTNATEKSVSIEKIDGQTFDHAIRFSTGNSDERAPGIIGHNIDNEMNDAGHIRITAPRLTSDQDDLSASFIGLWERNPNYIYDAGFENGITGWTGMANTTLAWNQTDGYSDATSLSITATGTISSPATTELLGSYNVSTLQNSELIGQTLTVSGKAKMGTATGRNVRLVVKYLDEAGAMISGWYIEKAITNAAWTSYSFYTPSVIPDTCYTVQFFFSWFNGATGDVVLVDEVQLEAGGLTKFRSGQASTIALNSQVVRSSGAIIISADTDLDLPPNVYSDGRQDTSKYPGIIMQSEGGTSALRMVNYTDSYGNRASTTLAFFNPSGTEESAVRVYGSNDDRFPGQIALVGPAGGFALATQANPDSSVTTYDTRIYGSLIIDGDMAWTPASYSSALTPFSTRAPGYCVQQGIVKFRGVCTVNNPITTGSGGTTLWTMPTGLRPASPMYLTTTSWTGGTTYSTLVHVQTDGTVLIWSPSAIGNSITFEGLSYPLSNMPTTTTPGADTTAPGTPSNFKISALSSGSSTGTYRLSWTNPTATDLAGVKIIWRSDRYPTVTIASSGTKTLTTDGKVITISGASAAAKTYDHSSLPVNKTIYYRVVSYDKSGNHSTYVSASRYLLASPVTVYADSSDAYRLGYGGMWRNDGDDVYQGDWTGNDNHRGLFFYGTKIYDAVNKGGVVRTPTKMTIYMKRTGSGGNYSGVGINLRGHVYQTKPAGDPIGGMTNEGSDGDNITYLSPNEGATITIPSSWYNNFVDSNAANRLEGLGVYGSSSSDYAIIYGRGNSSSNGKVTIYHKG
ncbi:hypothetical protein SEA_BILLNYE_39 [Streptomyces phage BillNye]|uniref:Fibronectin type-III domain-containing protein n=1 Tax=Streptomyces phage BillNye TaxID=2079426 RepID=A0A2L1IVN0_9CAUD|nr:minor tail protein [Streptomyces phage BillNye]AVD99241.1 hypothetical protein SEA_BILLNYE_39 [Streptomyces phage BillNye]